MRRTSAHGFSMKQAEPRDRAREREGVAQLARLPIARGFPLRGTLEDYGVALRKAANAAAGRVPPPACAHASPFRSVPLARWNLRPCWHCWYSWCCRLQAGAEPPCGSHVVDQQVTGEMQRLD